MSGGIALIVIVGILELWTFLKTITHWHITLETGITDLYCSWTNTMLSLWYLDFYCNPSLQAAVVMKITVEGLSIVRRLCAENIKKYVHYDEVNNIGNMF